MWFLSLHQQKPSCRAPTLYRRRRIALGSIFLISTVTHVGAFSIALLATWMPSLLTTNAAQALHIMHSLSGVPDHAAFGLSAVNTQGARLRQINEMIGTSSGFFLTVGLLCHTMDSVNQRLRFEMIAWMFFVSLIAGPAAGGAAVLLARDWILATYGLEASASGPEKHFDGRKRQD